MNLIRKLSVSVRPVVTAALSIACTVTPAAAVACTGIILACRDGATIPARTMEFSFDIQSDIYVVPAGTKITTLVLDEGNTGFTYEARYGFLGANGLDKPIVFDGLNEAGLYFGAFYFAGQAVFEEVSESNRERAVSSEELGNWVLAQFAKVEEVREALPSIEVVGTHIDEISGVAPFHYAVSDASGASIVIEYTASGLSIHENTVHAITNNPAFDWHLTNLRGYVGLSPMNRETIQVGSAELRPFGQGTGMVGLPGDFSSPSRFVRAVAFANSSLPCEATMDGVFKAFHILNAFDIPKGAIREAGDSKLTDYTVWTSVAGTKTKTYYYKTYLSQSVESLDVRDAVSRVSEPTTLVMESGFSVRNRNEDL